MTGALGSAAAGMSRAMDRVDATASRIARLGTNLPGADAAEPATEVADLLRARNATTMNASVARIASDMQKRAIDILV